MRSIKALVLIPLLMFGLDAAAADATATLLLDESSPDVTPSFSLLDQEEGRLLLEFRLPELQSQEIMVDGEEFQEIGFPGGELRGELGRPALPTITRLIAVPEGATVTARVIAVTERAFDGFRLMPAQSEGAESFAIDRQAYQQGSDLIPPSVEIGEAGRMRGQTVVPLTLRPVAHDPASGRLSVASRMEVELEFAGGDREELGPIPESFHRLFTDVVLGYRADEMTVVPGTYLMICRNDAEVIATLEPVLDWRRRQGYNVVLETLTGGENSAQIKTLILGYYVAEGAPLEFVSIVGDATGYLSVPAGGGQGDHSYTRLDGADQLSDIHIGRLSIQGIADLERIVDKIINYEINPPTADMGWFTRACMTADPGNSGTSTIYISQWCKAELLAHGFTQVDTIFNGNFASQMTASINQGLAGFGYRGYLGMSGMSTGYISSLTNGYKLPFAVIPTCGSGSWVGDTNCRSEAFLRAPNGGAIGAIATATLSTHTRYNNCFFHGVWEEAINGSDQRLGTAHTRGKIDLYVNYIDYEPGSVSSFCEWNNLMGDPATEMWTGTPATMAVEHPAFLPPAANSVPVQISVGGDPLAGARVCAYQAGQVVVSGYTDASGFVNLPLDGAALGTLSITALSHNHFPYLGEIALSLVPVFAGYTDHNLDDDELGESSGNGDAILNPNESIELPVALRNFGSSSAPAVSATLSTTDPLVMLSDAEESFGDIAAGAVVWSGEDFDFQLSAEAPDGHVVILDLVATSAFNEWTSQIRLSVQSSAFSLESSAWDGGGGTLDPGESGNLTVEIRNIGSIPGTEVRGVLSTDSPWIMANPLPRDYGSMGVGETASANFALVIAEECFSGHAAEFSLTLDFDDGRSAVTGFTLPVGTISSNDPMGPDDYGYYAFDNTDTTYPDAPVYDWIEIDPTRGGSGTSVGLTDFSYEDDDTKVMDLPFEFTYYGQAFDQVSICSNGWIAMGVTSLVHWRNWYLPAAGSPNPLIAVFWDDLIQNGNNKVYYYYDALGGRYIVQWSRLTKHRTGALENVQVILFDPDRHPTHTGDGKILMQYEDVTNNHGDRGYATVGIQNLDGTDGLCYTYANDYHPAAASLVDGRAILFQPASAMDPTAAGDSAVPIATTLLPNVPNPFNPETRINFALAAEQQLSLRVFDTSGRLIRTLLAGQRLESGHHSVSWDGRDDSNRALGSGIYYYVLETGQERLSGKMTLLK